MTQTNFFYTELNVASSDYYNLENANEVFVQNSTILSFLSLNVRSLHTNLDKVLTMLDEFESQIDIICMNETWVTPVNQDLHNISGYQVVHKCRENRRGGGIAVYVNFKFPFIKLEESCKLNKDIEWAFIKIDKDTINHTKKPTLLLGRYTDHPQGTLLFLLKISLKLYPPMTRTNMI